MTAKQQQLEHTKSATKTALPCLLHLLSTCSFYMRLNNPTYAIQLSLPSAQRSITVCCLYLPQKKIELKTKSEFDDRLQGITTITSIIEKASRSD